ncbi:MAG TPA: penicillin-binding protein 2 [Phycisphaerae bacterium]|jgi:cell division protein FtsI (penicillin-binding protein 3)
MSAISAAELVIARGARRQTRVAVITLAGVLATLTALGARLIYINQVLAPRFVGLAQSQQDAHTVIPARRGQIFDARGRVIAGSEMLPTVFVDPSQIEHPDEVAAALAPVLGMDAGELEDRIRQRSDRSYCPLKREVPAAEAQVVRELRLRGVGVGDASCRRYPMGRLMSQTIGFVGRDGDGLEGLELAYDAFLRGRDGQRVTIRDAQRRILADQDGATAEPVDGGHLVLTLDAVIQDLVEQELAHAVSSVDAEFGMSVVMAPRTGEILALATWPTYHPTELEASPPQYRRNRTVTDAFEPGSVFKPFVMSGALTRRVVSPAELIDCHNGSFFFGRRLIHDTKPSGALTPEGIIARSSNIGMGIIGTRMGNPALHDIITRFGFGVPTGVGFPGESPGLALPLKEWNVYSTTSVPMGHETMVTPLQLATAMCALCNDGVLLRPRLVKALLNADGTVKQSFDEPRVLRQVVPTEIAHWIVQKAMVAVVAESAHTDSLLGEYRIAGKTGTAQVPYPHRRGYQPEAYLSSFMGTAPADHPQVVALVMIYKPNPRKGYYGRVVSLPAVRDILVGSLGYLQVSLDPAALEAVARASE